MQKSTDLSGLADQNWTFQSSGKENVDLSTLDRPHWIYGCLNELGCVVRTNYLQVANDAGQIYQVNFELVDQIMASSYVNW